MYTMYFSDCFKMYKDGSRDTYHLIINLLHGNKNI